MVGAATIVSQCTGDVTDGGSEVEAAGRRSKLRRRRCRLRRSSCRIYLFVVSVVGEENLLIEAEIKELDDVTMNEDVEANVILESVKINTPRPSLYLHNETPGGTTYWEPNVDEPYLPFEGKCIDMIEECVEFYSVHDEKGGFEVKKLAQKKTKSGMVKSKYVMCNREGVPKEININRLDPQNSNKQIRNTRYRITGCTAQIKVDLDHVSGKYEITKFVAKHNHQLFPKEYKHLTKKQRKMPQAEKNVCCESFNNETWRNKGTQLVFQNERKKFVPNFTFYYLVKNSELVAMFCPDEVAKCNYKEFGDILSFDATFRTNKLCMWHIMQKVPAKICLEIYDETDFKEHFGKLVWNMFIEPLEFEGKWSKLVEDFGLQNHKWITKMFDLRHMWLPAYFIYSPLFGLMRTTSRSESENAFLKNFTNHASTLVVRNPEDGSVECTCRHFLRYRQMLVFVKKDEEQLKQFVEKLENIKKEIQVKVPNPPYQKTGERRKSGREIAMKAKAKRARKRGYCVEKTNKHTKTTCPLNPKYIVKLARIEAVAEQERRTDASATEQEERNSDTTHIADKEQSNTAS
nr:FAR1 DNA binding domain-containing protein [Tanacetum cinerariifolium]